MRWESLLRLSAASSQHVTDHPIGVAIDSNTCSATLIAPPANEATCFALLWLLRQPSIREPPVSAGLIKKVVGSLPTMEGGNRLQVHSSSSTPPIRGYRDEKGKWLLSYKGYLLDENKSGGRSVVNELIISLVKVNRVFFLGGLRKEINQELLNLDLFPNTPTK